MSLFNKNKNNEITTYKEDELDELVDYSEDKKRIEQYINETYKPMQLEKFPQKKGLFKYKITGDDANKIIKEIEKKQLNSFKESHKCYEEMLQLYTVIENINKEHMRAISVAQYDAVEASNQASYTRTEVSRLDNEYDSMANWLLDIRNKSNEQDVYNNKTDKRCNELERKVKIQGYWLYASVIVIIILLVIR